MTRHGNPFEVLPESLNGSNHARQLFSKQVKAVLFAVIGAVAIWITAIIFYLSILEGNPIQAYRQQGTILFIALVLQTAVSLLACRVCRLKIDPPGCGLLLAWGIATLFFPVVSISNKSLQTNLSLDRFYGLREKTTEFAIFVLPVVLAMACSDLRLGGGQKGGGQKGSEEDKSC